MKPAYTPLRHRLAWLLVIAGLLAAPLGSPQGRLILARATAASTTRAEGVVTVEAAESAAEKLRRIRAASDDGAAGSLTEFSETEVNSYLAYELGPRFPAGLTKVQVRFFPGRIHGTSEVDFDKAKAARPSPGGMTDYLFWGTHTLEAEGSFSAIDGVGHFDLESVALDGVRVPQPVVDLLIERFLKSRYPGLVLDAPFLLPYSIDRVQVMRESLLVEVNPPAAY
jgi:hypothetical protein